MEIIKDFGINPILLLAQIVNFLILVFILNKIMFKPLLKVLDERRQKIAQSLKDAEQISQELIQAEKKGKDLIKEASSRADQIVNEAKETATQIRAEAQTAAKNEADKIFQKTQEALVLEKEKMRAGVRSELMEVVVLATEKIMGKSLSPQEKQAITKDSLKELS